MHGNIISHTDGLVVVKKAPIKFGAFFRKSIESVTHIFRVTHIMK